MIPLSAWLENFQTWFIIVYYDPQWVWMLYLVLVNGKPAFFFFFIKTGVFEATILPRPVFRWNPVFQNLFFYPYTYLSNKLINRKFLIETSEGIVSSNLGFLFITDSCLNEYLWNFDTIGKAVWWTATKNLLKWDLPGFGSDLIPLILIFFLNWSHLATWLCHGPRRSLSALINIECDFTLSVISLSVESFQASHKLIRGLEN